MIAIDDPVQTDGTAQTDGTGQLGGSTQEDRTSIADAFQEWSNAIGSQHVDASEEVCRQYGRSTSPWRQAPIGVLSPGTADEVQAVVRIAAKNRVAVYPVSGGKNWGLGDACPTGPGQVVVHLRRLNRIREVNEELGYAVVEAGVTQGQLYEHLRENYPDLMMDATGAGPNATIVGNIMERGFGHSPLGDRFHNSCNYEVVLSNGELIRTGFGAFENATTAHLLKAGLGPSRDGLFTQSNLGVVTSMTVWLMPRPERVEAFAFKVDDDARLGAIIDALRPLRLQGTLTSTIHIANDLRLISSKTTYPYDETGGQTPLTREKRQELRQRYQVGAWNVLGGVYGSHAIVRATRDAVRKALRGVATPRFVNDGRLALAKRALAISSRVGIGRGLAEQVGCIESAYELLKGKPVAEHLRGAAWRRRESINSDASQDPLDRGDGLVWLSPTLPMTGGHAVVWEKIATETLESYGFEPLMTFVSISGRAMCAPTTICYDRTDVTQTQQAQRCYKQLFDRAMKAGYTPYRLGTQSMRDAGLSSKASGDAAPSAPSPSVLAPGRYAPL